MAEQFIIWHPEIMKKIYFITLLLVFSMFSCEEGVMPEPENLVKRKQMIDMLVDMHMAEATYNHLRYDSIMQNNSSVNFYYSVLKKYEVADSVFEKSYVYYASTPKDFDKMYRKVMSKISEIEQQYSGRKNELLEFDDEKKKEKK